MVYLAIFFLFLIKFISILVRSYRVNKVLNYYIFDIVENYINVSIHYNLEVIAYMLINNVGLEKLILGRNR